MFGYEESHFEDELERLRRENAWLRVIIQQQHAAIDDRDAAIASLKDREAAMLDRHANELERLRAENASLARQVQQLGRDNASINAMLNDLSTFNVQLSDETKVLQVEVASLKESLQELSAHKPNIVIGELALNVQLLLSRRVLRKTLSTHSDRALRRAWMAPAGVPIEQLRPFFDDTKQVDSSERTRWEGVCKRIADSFESFANFQGAVQALKEARKEFAHGDEKEKSGMTKEQLLGYATLVTAAPDFADDAAVKGEFMNEVAALADLAVTLIGTDAPLRSPK